MKLIKQNDSAGGLIFKQNQNGKAMKQNYNFGKGFNSEAGSFYLESKWKPSLLQPFSLVFWNFVDPPTSGSSILSTMFALKDLDNSLKLGLGIRLYNNLMLLTTANNFDTGTVSAIYRGSKGDKLRVFSAVRSDGINIRLTHSGGTGYNRLVSSLNQSEITNLYFALTKFTGIFYYERRLLMEIQCYSRYISDIELSYMENYGLGNDPLNVSGLEVRHTNSFAKILDYKGDDSVCIEDFSGKNNHSILRNLPAGTLQEQLDYANNNLFFSSL